MGHPSGAAACIPCAGVGADSPHNMCPVHQSCPHQIAKSLVFFLFIQLYRVSGAVHKIHNEDLLSHIPCLIVREPGGFTFSSLIPFMTGCLKMSAVPAVSPVPGISRMILQQKDSTPTPPWFKVTLNRYRYHDDRTHPSQAERIAWERLSRSRRPSAGRNDEVHGLGLSGWEGGLRQEPGKFLPFSEFSNRGRAGFRIGGCRGGK